ncbi:MAG: DUF1697 domain-containing protein [Micropruina sp.]|nr:DUF1697 domain-containing protein [Micropruina sp.]
MTGTVQLVALLRAINLGATRKVPMAELRALASERGLSQVRTHLNSGNLLFASDRPPRSWRTNCPLPWPSVSALRLR